jgi:hypothetical protein
MSSATPLIFVSIAAYQDPYLWWTIDNAYRMANNPSRLRFGVVDQSVQSEREQSRIMPWAGQVRYLHVHPRYARGPCWARSLAYSFWENEQFLLQIDSHMWFQKGWDDLLIQEFMAVNIATNHPRHIISTYPAAFSFQDGQPVSAGSPGGVLVLRPRKDAELKADNATMMFEAVPVDSQVRIKGHHIGAGCLFSYGTLLTDVPYDPWLYFHGEEQNLAVRAWTHGWEIWHPVNMPILHLYKEGGGKEIVHWSPDEDAMRDFRWGELQGRAQRRLCDVLYTQTIKGAYGLGKERTLTQYAAESGIDYVNKTVDHQYKIPVPLQPPPLPEGQRFAPQVSYTLTVKR